MKVPITLEVHNPPTVKNDLWIKTFVKMLTKMYERVAQVINGQLSFGRPGLYTVNTPIPCDNFDGVLIETANPVTANSDTTLNHNLNRLPVGYIVYKQTPNAANTPGIAFDGGVAATTSQITLRFSTAGQYFVLVF